MKKGYKILVIFSIATTLVLFFLNKQTSYSTLKQALEASSSNPIEILSFDDKTRIVLFKLLAPKNEQDTYVINKYVKTSNGRFTYATESEFGFLTNSPHTTRIQNFEGTGNVIWGIINTPEYNKLVHRVEVVFRNNLDEQNFKVEGHVQNNVFFMVPPAIYKNTSLVSANWSVETILLDRNEKILVTYQAF